MHDGRRIVETALENVSINRNWIQKIKGRKVRGEDSPYSRPAVEKLCAKYREALPELEFLGLPQAPMNPRELASEFLKRFVEKHPDKFEKFEKWILDL